MDTRSLKEKWLASLASRPLLDLKPRNRAVHNYSKVNFSKRATEVLGLGFKFCPTLKPPKQDDLKSQFNAFCRSVRLNTLFSSEGSIGKDDYNPRLYVRSDWDPPRSDLVLESNLRAIWYDLSLNLFNKPNWLHNLNYPDYQAIRQIKDSESVIVLPADKNLGPVILDKEWVINETLGMLMTDSYAMVDESEWLLKRAYIIKQRDKVCDIYKHLLSETELKYLSHFDDLSESLLPARFYIIPKIHKNPMVGRPITASCSYITRPISVLVDEYLKPVLSLPTVLRDSSELIVDLDGKELPPHCILFTADVVSLYPSINIKRAILAIDTLLREHRAQETPLLTTLLRLVLENNFVKCDFSTQIFLQLLGLAMGTPLAVTVANAFMYFIERHLVQSYREKGYLLYFKCFIDDIIGIWNGNLESLKCFLSEYDNLENGINITHVISFDRLSYLDTWISISKESPHRVEFSTYQKPLNKYLYIPFESFHPNSNKKAFIKGELIRYCRSSSTFKSFNAVRHKFWERLRLRGYPFKFLLPIFRSVTYADRSTLLKPFSVKVKQRSRSKSVVVFKTTYNFNQVRIKQVIKKHLPLLDCVVTYTKTKTLRNLVS